MWKNVNSRRYHQMLFGIRVDHLAVSPPRFMQDLIRITGRFRERVNEHLSALSARTCLDLSRLQSNPWERLRGPAQ